jgi:hypothetical protein
MRIGIVQQMDNDHRLSNMVTTLKFIHSFLQPTKDLRAEAQVDVYLRLDLVYQEFQHSKNFTFCRYIHKMFRGTRTPEKKAQDLMMNAMNLLVCIALHLLIIQESIAGDKTTVYRALYRSKFF